MTLRVSLYNAARYKSIWGYELELLPVSAGALFKATGNASPATVPAKGEHQPELHSALVAAIRTSISAHIPFMMHLHCFCHPVHILPKQAVS